MRNAETIAVDDMVGGAIALAHDACRLACVTLLAVDFRVGADAVSPVWKIQDCYTVRNRVNLRLGVLYILPAYKRLRSAARSVRARGGLLIHNHD